MKICSPDKIILAKKKKENVRIFLDMDGVVAYWEKAAAESCDIDYEDTDIREKLKGGERLDDMVGGDDVMWPKIDKAGEEWWQNLEKFPWADRLYEELNKLSDDFSFLTSPSSNPVCASGKIKWLQKHFGNKFKGFLIGKNKHLCAGPNTILIDDDKKKVKKFREYGGHAYLWPHPLVLLDGDKDPDDVIDEVIEQIKEIKG